MSLAIAGAAQAKCPAGLPSGVYCGAPDAKAAPSGTYALDPNHTAVVAKVSHIGYSLSVFRFNKVSATLMWDPTAPATSKLSATVDTASITTPVPGFAAELSGDRFLKSAAFPQATFVSTAFHRIDATHGRVEGAFTLMGVTKPMVFDVVLIGAGKGFGAPRIGVEATSRLDPTAYGLPAMFADPIALILDAEFQRTP
jgi:polyisoprenoid-binding protein YceI